MVQGFGFEDTRLGLFEVRARGFRASGLQVRVFEVRGFAYGVSRFKDLRYSIFEVRGFPYGVFPVRGFAVYEVCGFPYGVLGCRVFKVHGFPYGVSRNEVSCFRLRFVVSRFGVSCFVVRGVRYGISMFGVLQFTDFEV